MAYTFVLVHGSWHSGRAWDGVVQRLAALGHTAYAPTLAGHGASDDKDVGHADCVASVVDLIRHHDLTDFVLVGHSFGGTVIQGVAEHVPDRVRRLVFCNAFVLHDGESLEDVIPPGAAAAFAELAQPDGGVALPFPLFRETFINDASIEIAKAIFDGLSPTPRRTQTDKVSLPTFFARPIPKSFLNCTEDTAAGFGGWHPAMSQRLGFYRLVQMPGSHEVMFTSPSLMADKILEAGRD